MDRRFSTATSSLPDAALKLCTVLANYWRTAMADQGYRPEHHLYARAWPEVARGPRTAARKKLAAGVDRASVSPWFQTKI